MCFGLETAAPLSAGEASKLLDLTLNSAFGFSCVSPGDAHRVRGDASNIEYDSVDGAKLPRLALALIVMLVAGTINCDKARRGCA